MKIIFISSQFDTPEETLKCMDSQTVNALDQELYIREEHCCDSEKEWCEWYLEDKASEMMGKGLRYVYIYENGILRRPVSLL